MRRLKGMCLFMIIALVMYGTVFFVLTHFHALIFRTGDYYYWRGGSSWQTFHEFDKDRHWDAVIIGSSHAMRGYDPSQFSASGHQAFNLGTFSQTPMNSYYVVKNYLDSDHVKLVIFDAYDNIFANTGLESTSDLSQNITSDVAAVGMVRALGDLRGLNLLTLRLMMRGDGPGYLNDTYIGAGFSAVPDTLTLLHPVKQGPLLVLEEQKKYFARLVALCRERGIPLVVASHFGRPVAAPSRHAIFAAYLREALEGTGVPYLDYTGLTDSECRSCFADEAGHLNTAGAGTFTTLLVDSLEHLGYLQKPHPHR